MRRSSSARVVKLVVVILVNCWLDGGGLAFATPQVGEHDLQLEVVVNGNPTGLIGAFRRRANGALAASSDELQQLGLRPDPLATGPDGLIDVVRLPDLTYRLDTAAQTVWFDVDDRRRLPRVYDLRGSTGSPLDTPPITSGYGTVLNYLVFATSDTQLPQFWNFASQRASVAASFDARAFSPFGVLSQTAILGSAFEQGLRLDTTWSYSDPGSLISYRAGDVISGGLTWTRSIRLGGLQMQRNFALRPDLVTTPMPGLSGSAAVPSTLDVYLNNIRVFSRDLPAGPFEVKNLPIVSGPGTQRIVVRDSLGRETVSDQAFYASPKLLRAGFYDFSVEAGFPRLDFGVRSNEYEREPVASASLRRGITDWLTVEGHVEGGERLWNGGAGVVFPVGPIGVASVAAATSSLAGDNGTQVAASFEAGLGSIIFYVRAQRTFGRYLDIAATALQPLVPSTARQPVSAATAAQPLSVSSWQRPLSYLPPRELAQFALSFPLGFDPARLTLSYTHLRDDLGGRYQVVGASYSRPIDRDVSLFATAYTNVVGSRGYGIFAGITRSFGDGITATAGGASSAIGTSGGVDVVKSQPIEIGSSGWRLREREGGPPERAAVASYRAPFARLQAGVEQFGDVARVSGEAEGAVVLTAGNVFLTNRIDDAFAVVDAGAPGVDVLYENRPVGKTDARGQLLVPYLNAYQRNRLSIDPRSLPVDADVARTREWVVPADRSGAVVKFGVDAASQSALVSFRDQAGRFIAVGARGQLEATGEAFVVGYDGQAYLQGLQPANAVVIATADGGTCRSQFAFLPQPGTQVRIEDVPCQ
jgi:outer membrane usher protein